MNETMDAATEHAGIVLRCEGGRPSIELEPLARGVSAMPAEDLEELGRVLRVTKSDDYQAFLAVFGHTARHTGSFFIWTPATPARKRKNVLLDLDRRLVNHIGAYLDYLTVQHTSPELPFIFDGRLLSIIKDTVNMKPKLRNICKLSHAMDWINDSTSIMDWINDSAIMPIKNDSLNADEDLQNKHAFYELPSSDNVRAYILTKTCLVAARNSTTGFHLQTFNLDTGDSTSLVDSPDHTISAIVANGNFILLTTKHGVLFRYSIDENFQIELLDTYDADALDLTLSPDGTCVIIETVMENMDVFDHYIRIIKFNTFVEIKNLKWCRSRHHDSADDLAQPPAEAAQAAAEAAQAAAEAAEAAQAAEAQAAAAAAFAPEAIDDENDVENNDHNEPPIEIDPDFIGVDPEDIELMTPEEKRDFESIQFTFSPDSGSVLMFVKAQNVLAFMNLKTQEIVEIKKCKPIVQSYTFSPDSKLVVTKTLEHQKCMVELWDSTLKAHTQSICLPSIPGAEQNDTYMIQQDQLSVSNDGEDLLVCNGNAIYLCNVGMARVQQILVDPSDAIGCRYISNTIVGHYCDDTIKIWQ